MINFKHPEYVKWAQDWEKDRDGISGEGAVKDKNERYLPKLGGQTPTAYSAYLRRANYINFSGRTLQAGLGQILRKNPVLDGIDEPERLYYVSKAILSEMMTTNRGGILVDYDEIKDTPETIVYRAEDIINWRYTTQLDFVVLSGSVYVEDPADKYKVKKEIVYKELYLEEGVYKYRLWHKEKEEYVPGDETVPEMLGQRFSFIPFFFVTTNGNTPDIDKAPLSDLINLNLSHYRNNADYENMLHWTGAKTIVTKGWGDKPFPIGGAPDFPTDGGAEFLEASSDSGLKDELTHKEEAMAILGSSLLSGKSKNVIAAETARITSSGEYATLADISNAMSDVMTKVYAVYGAWQGKNPDEISITYNTDFETAKLDATTLTAWMTAVMNGQLSQKQFFWNMQKSDMYEDGWTFEEEQTEIEAGETDGIDVL